jgi:hypothetical protein
LLLLAYANAGAIIGPSVNTESGSTCPGSAAWVHAKTEISVSFSNSCADVMKEIEARVKGPWTDPHNNGTYTITSSSATQMALNHVTGSKKYTDKVLLTFSGSGSTCSVDACSESQVTSVLDFSTNFCNIHDLYCSDSGCNADGAAHTKLTYKEDVKTCSSGQKSTSDCYKTTAGGVTPLLMSEVATPYCLHNEDKTPGHIKCYEACSLTGAKFKAKGYNETGSCPIHFNTKDTTSTETQCPDGVTNLKYCASTKLNVTLTTKGEAGLCHHNEDAVDHKCYEACAVKDFVMKGFATEGFCPDKYNLEESSKTVRECPDGKTNIKYCAATAVEVTVRTIGTK